MEKEITFLEFFLMIARFIKRHFKKYVVTAIFFLFISLGYYFFWVPAKVTTLSLSSDFFDKKEILTFVNDINALLTYGDSTQIQKQFGVRDISVFENVKEVSYDTLQPVFTKISIKLIDTTGENEIKKGILFFIRNNEYSKNKIAGIYNKNQFLLKKLQYLEKFYFAKNQGIDVGKRANIVYTNWNIINSQFYEDMADAQKIVSECSNNRIISSFNDFSFLSQKDNFVKIEVILFLLLFLGASFLFFVLDINRLLKQS